ncbi:class II aldolase [Synergistales bacterium]|nr:class II aldolase [Synergistales bacterium]
MGSELNGLLKEAIWITTSLFNRGKVSGATANLSFICGDEIYITATGSCFGSLREEDFARVGRDGALLGGPKPSRESPLHLSLYRRHPEAKAVLHTHSPWTTTWSCLEHPDPCDVMPDYTPYLRSRVGRVALVPYAPPGSPELFGLLDSHLEPNVTCYLLSNHGPIAAGPSLSEVFYDIEELEDSARIACFLPLLADVRKSRLI